MKFALQLVYVVGVLVWVTDALLCPTWVGRFYNPDRFDDPQAWHGGGVFGLRDASGFTKRSPIWDPPTAHSDRIHPAVRWPWEAPNRHEHVEISLGRLVARWSYGLLGLGLVCPLLRRFLVSREPDIVLSVAWWIALWLALAWAVIVVLAVLSMGYAVTDGVVIGILSVATVAGLGCGLGTFSWRRSQVEPVE